MIKILLADTHPLVRKMLKETLERESDMKVISEAESTRQVMDGLRKQLPDVVLTSLSLPGKGSLKMIKELKRLYPGLPVLVLTMHPEELFRSETMRSGASRYLTKDVPPEKIILTVRELISPTGLLSGSAPQDSAASGKGARELGLSREFFSRREFQIICALAAGKEGPEIAKDLNLTLRTVSAHLSRIMKKMGIESMPELRRCAAESKLTAS